MIRAATVTAAAMNLRIEDAGPAACTLTTETRVYATDTSTRRHFAFYWRVIYPGSALIRRMWLRAIARRAESRGVTELAARNRGDQWQHRRGTSGQTRPSGGARFRGNVVATPCGRRTFPRKR